MTIDTEGMLWIALWDGWKVARYNPFKGEQLSRVLFYRSPGRLHVFLVEILGRSVHHLSKRRPFRGRLKRTTVSGLFIRNKKVRI